MFSRSTFTFHNITLAHALQVWMLLKELVLVIPHRRLSSKSLLLSLVALDQAGKHMLMTTLMTNLKLHSQNLRRTRRKRRMEKIKVCQWRAVSLH